MTTPSTPPRAQPPHRKRMKRREAPGGVRFITFSCQRRLPVLAARGIADLFVCCLDDARRRIPMDLLAWVVMPEHVHLMVRGRIGGPPVGLFLRSLKTAVSKRAIPALRAAGDPLLAAIDRRGVPRLWQPGGGFDRNVRDADEFVREVRYIHMNPVERGLVDRPEQWRWSSVRWWMGLRGGELACDEPPWGGAAVASAEE